MRRWFDVEMQIVAEAALRERMLYYWARIYAAQLTEGKGYDLLRPTVAVWFLDGSFFPGQRCTEDERCWRSEGESKAN